MAKIFELYGSDYNETKALALADAKVAGDFVTMEDSYGFFLIGGAIGDELIAITKADRVLVQRIAAQTWKAGEALYYVAATDDVSNVAGADILIGYATEAVAAAVTHGMMSFDGRAAFEKA